MIVSTHSLFLGPQTLPKAKKVKDTTLPNDDQVNSETSDFIKRIATDHSSYSNC